MKKMSILSISSNMKQLSYTIFPSQFIHSLSSSLIDTSLLLSPPKMKPPRSGHRLFKNPKLLLFILLVGVIVTLGMMKTGLDLVPIYPFPCGGVSPEPESTASPSAVSLSVFRGSEEDAGGEFWEQPEGYGYRPCLELSEEYWLESEATNKQRKRFLMVVVSEGMNQQRK